jgi:hypothetical protein
MKFKSVEAAKKGDVKTAINRITIEDILNDMEMLRQCDKEYAHARAELCIPLSFNAMIEKSAAAGKPAVESLTGEQVTDLADALGCSNVDELKEMSLESFIDKCESKLEIEDASQEVIGIVICIVAYFAILFTLAGIASMCETNEEPAYFESIYRQLEKAFGKHINDAIDGITVNTWTRKEYEAQAAAIAKCLEIIKKPADDIFDEKFDIKVIERAAAGLWACPQGWLYEEDGSSWSDWYGEAPDRQRGKTLKELGFDVNSLIKVSNDIRKLCLECVTLSETKRDLGKVASKKLDKGGFIKRIVTWWKDRKKDAATKEEEARQRRIIMAKYDACYWLCRGISWCLNIMASDMIIASKKAETLAKKGPAAEA